MRPLYINLPKRPFQRYHLPIKWEDTEDPMTQYENWLLEENDRVLTLTLNRPAQHNRITPETLYELREITVWLEGRRDIWAVVVEGAGEHFSTGVDVNIIGLLVGQDEQVYRKNLRDLQDCVDRFEQLEKATIARVHGYCLGGGLILALCCDLRVAAETAVFGLPEVKRSIAVVMGTQRITRVAGVGAAKEMILLAENFDARQAQRYGLVQMVVGEDELETAVATLADKFRRLPPRAIGVAKRIIDRGYPMTLRDSQNLEIDAQHELLNSPDFREAVASFFEKRPPRYTGE